MSKRDSYNEDVLRQACQLYNELSFIKENAGMFIGAKNSGCPDAFNSKRQQAKSLIKKVDSFGLSDIDIFSELISKVNLLYKLKD